MMSEKYMNRLVLVIVAAGVMSAGAMDQSQQEAALCKVDKQLLRAAHRGDVSLVQRFLREGRKG